VADDVERSEEATPKRREEARREGQLAISQDAFIFANLTAVTLALLWTGQRALLESLGAFHTLWAPRSDLELGEAVELFRSAFAGGARIAAPMLLAALAAGVAIGLLQTRGNWAPARIRPKLSRLSPAQNWKRVLSPQAVIEAPKALLKLALLGTIVGAIAYARLAEYLGLSQLSALEAARYQCETLLLAFLAGCGALLVLAAADYAYQHHRHEQQLRMTPSDVKQERRQSEGDPLVRSRLRSLQLERARSRMMAEVPKADVVITNPEHFSVALRYQRPAMRAPQVLAKGRGLIALRIRELAREAGVPIVENPPLARALYRAVKVGCEIPDQLFQAVAQVLAYVHRLDPRRSRSW
jgi:flagellar biosynthetic protein FlhB